MIRKLFLLVGLTLFIGIAGGTHLGWIFGGDETKTICLGIALIALSVIMYQVHVFGMTEWFRPYTWGIMFGAGLILTWGGVWDVPGFLQGNPRAATLFYGLICLGVVGCGMLWILSPLAGGGGGRRAKNRRRS
jgi:hypothetical protein